MPLLIDMLGKRLSDDKLTLMLLVANLPNTNDAKSRKITETLAHGYSTHLRVLRE